MKHHVMMMVGLSALCLVALACQSTGGPPASQSGKDAFDLSNLDVVAFMGVSPGSGADELAVPMVEPMLERQLEGIRPPFVLLSGAETETRARTEGVYNDFKAVSDYWRDRQKVDKMKLQSFCQALGIQGILVASVRDWMQVEAQPNADEPAYTKIGMRMEIYAADTGRRVWRTRTTRTVEATQFQDDESAASRTNPMSTGFVGGLRTGADAPPLEQVAQMVVEELAATLDQ